MIGSLISHGMISKDRRGASALRGFLRREVSRAKKELIEKKRRVLAGVDRRPVVSSDEFFSQVLLIDPDSSVELLATQLQERYTAFCEARKARPRAFSVVGKELRGWIRKRLLSDGVGLGAVEKFLSEFHRREKVMSTHDGNRRWLYKGLILDTAALACGRVEESCETRRVCFEGCE